MKYWYDQCSYCYLRDSCDDRISFEILLKESKEEIRCKHLIPEDILVDEEYYAFTTTDH